MRDQEKPKDQLINELVEIRARLAGLETTLNKRQVSLDNLEESEARLQRLIDTLPVCISYVDSGLHYRLNNKTYEDWFGVNRRDLIGHHIKEILGEERFEESKKRYEAILSGQTITIENVIPLKDGRKKHVVGTHVPDFGEDGQVKGFFALITDISEQVQVEKAIRESEERFHKIFDSSNDAIFLIDAHADQIIDANPRACEMLGYSQEELLSMGMSAIHPQEMPILMAFSQVVSEKGYGWTDELTCLTKSGNYLPAEISASMVEFEDRNLLVAMVRDTTERKKAEALIRREVARADALARAAARFNAHLTLDSVAEAVCEETALALNASAVLFLLYAEDQQALVPAASLGLPQEFVDHYQPVPQEISTNYTLQQETLVLISDVQSEPDLPNAELNNRYKVRTILSAGLIREKQMIGAISVYSLDEPRQFNDHELALLKGLADQATQAIDNARLRQRAEQAAVAAERGRLARELHDSITQSLYSLTLLAEGWRRQASAGKLEQVEEPLSELGDIAQQALKEMRLMVYELRPPELEQEGLIGALRQRLGAVEKRSGVEARLLVDEIIDLPIPLENALYRIAQEALNNTLKHATATSVIVHLRSDDGTIVLEVIDDGVGFDPSTNGTLGGIGLASMRERVQQMGGSLEITSDKDKGTTVKVMMNLKKESHE